MKIQINTLCFQYWRRFFWCLSSIVEQIRPIPDIKIRVNTCLEMDSYKNIQRGTEKIFRNLLDIELVDWKRGDGFDVRENVRNKDILNIGKDVDYVLWLDPDQIIHPSHFNFLLNQLPEFDKQNRILSLIRRDISEQNSTKLIEGYKYRKPIENCLSKIEAFPKYKTRGVLGIGYYQLVSTRLLKERNITVYSDYKKDRGMWNKTMDYIFKTTSDMAFRKKIGVVKIVGTPGVYHLDHVRRKPRLDYFEKACL